MAQRSKIPGTYTLSDIVNLAGAKQQWVTSWSKAGALKPMRGTRHAGKGAYRRFHVTEVMLAAILTPLADWGVTIGEIAAIADRLRRGLFSTKAVMWVDGEALLRAKNRVIDGRAAWIMVAREGRGTRRKYHIGAVNRPDRTPVEEVEIKGRNLPAFEAVLLLNLAAIWGPVMKAESEERKLVARLGRSGHHEG